MRKRVVTRFQAQEIMLAAGVSVNSIRIVFHSADVSASRQGITHGTVKNFLIRKLGNDKYEVS
jgi:hypothetical protein